MNGNQSKTTLKTIKEIRSEVFTKIAMIYGPIADLKKFLKESFGARDLRYKSTWVMINAKIAYSDGRKYLFCHLDSQDLFIPGAVRLVESDNYLLNGIEYDCFTKQVVAV